MQRLYANTAPFNIKDKHIQRFGMLIPYEYQKTTVYEKNKEINFDCTHEGAIKKDYDLVGYTLGTQTLG